MASHIVFPKEVQERLSFIRIIEDLEGDVRESIRSIAEQKHAPINIVSWPPSTALKSSLTTAAIMVSMMDDPSDQKAAEGIYLKHIRPEEKRARRAGFHLISSTFGNDNPITTSFVISTSPWQHKRRTGLPRFAARKILQWVSNPSCDNPRSGYPAYQAYVALDACLKSRERFVRPLRRKMRSAMHNLVDWAEGQLLDQVSSYHSKHTAKFDVGNLAFVILLASCGQKTKGDDPLTEEAMRILFGEQAEDGLWHSSKPFWQESGRGCYLSNAQIIFAVVKLLNARPKLQRTHEQNINRYVRWLRNNLSEVMVRGRMKTLKGWALETNYSRNRIDIWVSLYNMTLLRDYAAILKGLNRADLLSSSGITVIDGGQTWRGLKPSDARYPRNRQLKRIIEASFIRPWKSNAPDRFSMVLFGPPGTSKTSLAEALTSALREAMPDASWKLAIVTPGDFISGGEAMAEINATNIFTVLSALDHIVVLFDEIDLLLLDRDLNTEEIPPLSGTLRFMTTSMLTKLQNLRSKKRCIFILTTNKYELLDAAVRRSGRFDFRFPVLPPDGRSRKVLIKEFVKDFDKKRGTAFLAKLRNTAPLVNATLLFTFTELKDWVKNTLSTLNASAPRKAILKSLLDSVNQSPPATSFRSYLRRGRAHEEVQAMLAMITKAEFLAVPSAEEREAIAKLCQRVRMKRPWIKTQVE